MRRRGLGHDRRRSFATIDPDYYKWTQWIFLQIFNSWYDDEAGRARPITELIARFESGERPVPGHTRAWSELSEAERADVLGEFRLAYASDAPVVPRTGHRTGQREVTADGRSERGNFPVFKAKLRQITGEVTVVDAEPGEDTLRALHKAIDGVRQDLEGMRFNTAIAKVTELNNHLTKQEGPVPRPVAEALVLLVAPLAPHIAEELWRALGRTDSVVHQDFPVADPAYVVDETVTCVVQIKGKVKARLEVPPSISEESWRRSRWPTRRSSPRWTGPGSAR
ncbi:hypothetical protein SHIRM173S_11774 [Streptomyces hirsutus]